MRRSLSITLAVTVLSAEQATALQCAKVPIPLYIQVIVEDAAGLHGVPADRVADPIRQKFNYFAQVHAVKGAVVPQPKECSALVRILLRPIDARILSTLQSRSFIGPGCPPESPIPSAEGPNVAFSYSAYSVDEVLRQYAAELDKLVNDTNLPASVRALQVWLQSAVPVGRQLCFQDDSTVWLAVGSPLFSSAVFLLRFWTPDELGLHVKGSGRPCVVIPATVKKVKLPTEEFRDVKSLTPAELKQLSTHVRTFSNAKDGRGLFYLVDPGYQRPSDNAVPNPDASCS
jgi:hypothetical protein